MTSSTHEQVLDLPIKLCDSREPIEIDNEATRAIVEHALRLLLTNNCEGVLETRIDAIVTHWDIESLPYEAAVAKLLEYLQETQQSELAMVRVNSYLRYEQSIELRRYRDTLALAVCNDYFPTRPGKTGSVGYTKEVKVNDRSAETFLFSADKS